MSATVKDVMTTRVAAVRKDAPYKDIATLLTQYRVSAFPVVDDELWSTIAAHSESVDREARFPAEAVEESEDAALHGVATL